MITFTKSLIVGNTMTPPYEGSGKPRRNNEACISAKGQHPTLLVVFEAPFVLVLTPR